EILDIGIDPEFLYTTDTEVELIGKYEMLPVYRSRDKFSHKGQFGHCVIIGGSYGKIGAAILASKAALTSGAGLVSAFVPKCGYVPLQSSFPEAMVLTDADEHIITDVTLDFIPSAVGIGVGLGTHENTIKAFEAFLKLNKAALVIDADGVNTLSKIKTLLKLVSIQTIITPLP